MIVESGTGTSAYFLHRHLSLKDLDIEVIAVPCIGSGEYLLQQMRQLDFGTGRTNEFPYILFQDMKRLFAKPYQEHLDIWWTLSSETGIQFDLIYTPRAMEQVLYWINKVPTMWKNTELMYLHCGGTAGVESQFRRYQRDKSILIPSKALRQFG